jgi:hypothetical protein
VIRDAIISDLKRNGASSKEFTAKSMKARRQSCVYLRPDTLNSIVEIYLDKINDWSFDVLEMREKSITPNPLVVITMASMASQGLMEGYITNEAILVEYLKRVEEAYFENPYHNSWHAADVVQATNYGILTSAAHVKFPRLDTNPVLYIILFIILQ